MDSRSIFREYCICKAGFWQTLDRSAIPWEDLSTSQKEILRKLPIIELTRGNPINESAELKEHLRSNPKQLEVIVKYNNRFYYTNLEGYEYMRYAFRIAGVKFIDELESHLDEQTRKPEDENAPKYMSHLKRPSSLLP